MLQEDPDKYGTVWFVKRKPVVLKPDEVLQLPGLVMFPGHMTESLVLIDGAAVADTSSDDLDVRPELHSASDVSTRRVTVSIKNVSTKEVFVKRGTPLAHVFPVSLVPHLTSKSTPEQPTLSTVTEHRSFLGFCGYYRRFVKDFSKLCRPLNELLQGYSSSTGTSKKKGNNSPVTSTKTCHKSSEPFGSRWPAQCDTAFQTLKKCLTQAPVLAFEDANKSYVLHVDASIDGLGGVLYQEHDEGLRPVVFISRSLSPSERNYPAHKLEFLALKWAVVDRLHEYLYGVQFEVRTDNNPLTYIMKSAKLDATGHRWLSTLTTYNFNLQYRPG